MQPELVKGTVQRVSVARLGGREIVLFDLRIPGETLHVVCVGGVGVGIVDRALGARVRTAMRTEVLPVQARLRARLEGGHVERANRSAVVLEREGVAWRVETAAGMTVRLVELDGSAGEQDIEADFRHALAARGPALVEALVRAGADARRLGLGRALDKALARVARRVEAVNGDLTRTGAADAMARRAQAFVVEASRAPRGASRLTATDWTTGEARPIELPLDPARGAREQIDAMFQRARRLKEGAVIARARLADAQATLDVLNAAKVALLDAGEAADADTLNAIESRARAAAPRDFKLAASTPAARRKADAQPRPAFRTFVGASGARILVGRGAAHNDALSLHVARPHDLWLHAKGQAGAHVVVPLAKGASCPAEVLVEAAHLAAHFSDARDESVVDVQYTPRRFIRKPRGSAPGLVVVDREKVLALRCDRALLQRLLENEAVPP